MIHTVHTYPSEDLIEHEIEGDECICGPTVDPIIDDEGSISWHVIHHSLDGRELSEEDGLRT